MVTILPRRFLSGVSSEIVTTIDRLCTFFFRAKKHKKICNKAVGKPIDNDYGIIHVYIMIFLFLFFLDVSLAITYTETWYIQGRILLLICNKP